MKLNMDELELPKTEKVKKLTQIMNQIKDKGNLLGVLFAYRDGGLIAENFKEEIDFDNFTSMCASVLESALSLGRTMGDRKAAKIIAELGTQTIVITECDEKTFLVFNLDYQSNFNVILEKMEDYIRKLIFLY
ncbi:MAG: roadblock/LC7 domain-containing protein [Promethearchaeota archaeon]|nr:MAG: roadblock/LC7 domain-containing protein [Candidatus Lokiarchaeota archaeon]